MADPESARAGTLAHFRASEPRGGDASGRLGPAKTPRGSARGCAPCSPCSPAPGGGTLVGPSACHCENLVGEADGAPLGGSAPALLPGLFRLGRLNAAANCPRVLALSLPRLVESSLFCARSPQNGGAAECCAVLLLCVEFIVPRQAFEQNPHRLRGGGFFMRGACRLCLFALDA